MKKVPEMYTHPSDVELYAFFSLRPGQKPESLVDTKLTRKRREKIEEHVSKCRSCRSLKNRKRIENSRDMGRVLVAFAIHDELWGGDTGEEPRGKRKRKLMENLRRV